MHAPGDVYFFKLFFFFSTPLYVGLGNSVHTCGMFMDTPLCKCEADVGKYIYSMWDVYCIQWEGVCVCVWTAAGYVWTHF